MDCIERFLVIVIAVFGYSRAFIVDKVIRKYRGEEVLPFSLFLFEMPRMRLMTSAMLPVPLKSQVAGLDEADGKKINKMTYTIYSLFSALLLLTFIS
ncbi:MAG: hypothetical protein ACJ77K_11020 [Bacteroidia bacterium]